MNGGVVWITGLSAAGKSTLANSVYKCLVERGNQCILLDGDDLRSVFFIDQVEGDSYSLRSRKELALRYSRLCHLLSDQGYVVLIATISMFKEVYSWNRENIENYFEIFLDTDKLTLQERDPKKIYDSFMKGEVKNVAGFDLLVEYPENFDLRIPINNRDSKETVLNVALENLNNVNWII